ncbi:MAG TPA: hypothetical protein VFQ60_00790 [Patescibacteria group bacterium]|nr:hypothetical protein [Patescibacteria group bacterium]
MKRGLILVFPFFLLVLFGAGCSVSSIYSRLGNTAAGFFTHQDTAVVSTSTAAFLSSRLSFSPGDSFSLTQTLFGISAPVDQTDAGQRNITITRFAPGEQVDLTWQMRVERETDASKMAREAYDAGLKAHPTPIGESAPLPPKIVFESVMSTGTIFNIDLARKQTLRLPSYWKEGNYESQDSSVIWMPIEAFRTLMATRQVSVSLGITESPITTLMKTMAMWKTFTAKLRGATGTEDDHQDPDLIQADGEFVLWPISINGTRKIVSAIRARSRYGELIILNNEKNPIVLKFTMNPFSPEAIVGDRGSFVQNFLGYEVTNLHLRQFTD